MFPMCTRTVLGRQGMASITHVCPNQESWDASSSNRQTSPSCQDAGPSQAHLIPHASCSSRLPDAGSVLPADYTPFALPLRAHGGGPHPWSAPLRSVSGCGCLPMASHSVQRCLAEELHPHLWASCVFCCVVGGGRVGRWARWMRFGRAEAWHRAAASRVGKRRGWPGVGWQRVGWGDIPCKPCSGPGLSGVVGVLGLLGEVIVVGTGLELGWGPPNYYVVECEGGVAPAFLARPAQPKQKNMAR